MKAVLPGRSVLAGLLFAVLYPAGMPGYGVPGVPFVCLVPFIAFSVTAEDPRGAARRGFLWGTAASLLLVYWIAYTVAVPGKLGWALGAVAALLVAAYLGIYISVAALAAHRLHRRFGPAGLLVFPAAWTALEMARSYLFTGFPWMLLGYSLSGDGLLRQAADVAGVYGLGFLLAFSSVLLHAGMTLAADRRRAAAATCLASFIAVPALLLGYGAVRDRELRSLPVERRFPVGIAQGGIDQSVKWDPARQAKTLAIYAALTREARGKGADVIVWPETAAPFFFGWEPPLDRRVEAAAVEAGAPLVFGAPWFDPADGGKYYNSVFLLDGRGIPLARYDKRHLVPFGEYIPMKTVLFFLRKLTHGEEDFSAGRGPALFPVKGTWAGASVCYEAVFPAVIRDSVREGAEWLINVTNDAWFGDTAAPRQHLAMARMRAVEFRRPLVRAANSGISAVVGIRGEILAELGVGRRGTIVAPVAPCRIDTFYAKTGEAFGVSCIIISALALLTPLRRGRDGIRTDRGTHRRARGTA
ncbi:MAG: apolipoprotein N-acyltransferase [Deltaproteobacteria bacterium]|nr:apolipoprotein N-acyltransferase [Deltaproteobacteria bacterium]